MRGPLFTGIAGAAFMYAMACSPQANRVCNDDSDCLTYQTESGFAACDTAFELCVEVECLANEHCEVGNWCNENNNCIPGCASDLDCEAGQACNTNTHACESYGCRSTELDCGYFETCNQGTGECELVTTQHCGECTDGFFGGECPGNGACYAFDDAQTQLHCLYPCPSEGCPRGTQCVDPNPDDTDTTNYCIADCGELSASGQLPW